MNQFFLGFGVLISLVCAGSVSAHVLVKPDKVGVASTQIFTVGVPNEKDTEVTNVRLLLPTGLQEVVPTAKSGWTITLKRNGSGDTAEGTEIDWSGSIPVGQRDDFSFSAQVPPKASTLLWKVTQTYKDGTVISWDQDPATIKAGQEGTPYSKTLVVNDLATPVSSLPQSDSFARLLGSTAFFLAILAIGFQLRRR